MHNALRILVLPLLLSGLSLDCHAVMTIRPMTDDAHAHQRRAPKTFMLNGHEQSRLSFITPDLQRNTLDTTQGRFKLPRTRMDNYHVLIAERRLNHVHEAAIRYVYQNGKPSGHSPAELTALQKTVFEIIPDPLPREHWKYKAGDRIKFFVSFNSTALANIPVTLSTQHGSILQGNTNQQGRVEFDLPDDFTETGAGENTHPAAEFLIHAKLNRDNQEYASWLNAEYYADPAHWRDQTLGIMVAGGGFLFGAFITGLGFRPGLKQD